MTPEEQAKQFMCPDLSDDIDRVKCVGKECIHYLEFRSPYPPPPSGYPQPRPFMCAKARP